MSAYPLKLETLAKIEGFPNVDDFLNRWEMHDSVIPAICTNVGCNYSDGKEPDSTNGYCEACDTTTMQSALILAGLI